MASAADRRRAQRQLRENLRAGRPTLPKSITSGYAAGKRQQSVAYLKQQTALPPSQRPAPGTEGGNVIARAMSYIANDDRYQDDYDSGEYDWAEDYWYHDG